MDTLELMMRDGHLHEWIRLESFVIVDERLEVSHQVQYVVGVLWRSVDDATGGIPECRPRQFAESSSVPLQFGLDFEDVSIRQKPGFPHPQISSS